MEKRSPGALIPFLRRLEKGLKEENVSVPCGSCRACCKDPEFIADLSPEEAQRMPSTTVHGRLVLPKQANGDCINLVDNKCVVYETRPRTCRIYDCRFHLFGLPLHNDCKVMREAVEQWEPFKLPTTEDKVAFGSIYTLVTEYAKKDPTLTGIAYLLTKWKTFRQQTYDLLQNVMRE